MKYNKIRKMDIADGPGVRVSIFMQGCAFNCKNCFNPETHDFNGGKEFTDATIDRIMELCQNENVEGLSISGGVLFLRIKNTYDGTIKIENGRVHAKRSINSHGIGLRSVQDLIKEQNGKIDIKATEEFFVVEGMIPLK